MLAYADSEFTLSEPQSDGIPLRAHLENIAKHSKELPEELANAVERPELIFYLWEWYCELSAERMRPGQMPSRISAESMKALEWYHCIKLEPWEKKALRMLDNLFFSRI